MRKDVQLGLAVGGVLLLVVIVYAVFFSGTSQVATNNTANNAVTPNKTTTSTPKPNDTPKPTPDLRQTDVRQGNQVASNTGNNTAGGAAVGTGNTGLGNTGLGNPGSGNTVDIGNTTSGNTSTGLGSNGGLTSLTPDASAPVTPAGWDWSAALNRGEGAHLLSRTQTPPIQNGNRTIGSGTNNNGTGNTSTTPGANGSRTNTDIPAASEQPYEVKQGETLWTIAEKTYGSGNYFMHIARANPKINRDRLKRGDKLILPPKDKVIPAGVTERTLTAVNPTTRPVDSQREYRVQERDNLTTISRRLYGNSTMVNKLYEKNKDLIGPNPSALKKGMVLILPEPPTNQAASTRN